MTCCGKQWLFVLLSIIGFKLCCCTTYVNMQMIPYVAVSIRLVDFKNDFFNKIFLTTNTKRNTFVKLLIILGLQIKFSNHTNIIIKPAFLKVMRVYIMENILFYKCVVNYLYSLVGIVHIDKYGNLYLACRNHLNIYIRLIQRLKHF